MDTLVDDVGSFPLPAGVSQDNFNKAYVKARQAIINKNDVRKDDFLLENFYNVIVSSFKAKCTVGLDVANYPQHYDMHQQIAELIQKAMEKGSYVVDEAHAVIPEVHVINNEAKRLSEEIGRKIALRVCVTGPLEMYLRIVGVVAYSDVLMMFAETVRRFAKNAILNTKHVETAVVSLDEPSYGFQEPSAEREALLRALEKAFDFTGATRQLHLHSPLKVADVLSLGNLDVVSFEFAASPKNIESISKRMLDSADKQIRVGITRTDIDSIIAEFHEKGITNPPPEQLVENEATIRKRFLLAKEKYGERMTFTGPDCGLGGWPSQETAQLLLARTVKAVKGSIR
ncbi:MAG: hypothetical protein QXJ02_07530 [Candidatus Bathyarchaeia archaeon]